MCILEGLRVNEPLSTTLIVIAVYEVVLLYTAEAPSKYQDMTLVDVEVDVVLTEVVVFEVSELTVVMVVVVTEVLVEEVGIVDAVEAVEEEVLVADVDVGVAVVV